MLCPEVGTGNRTARPSRGAEYWPGFNVFTAVAALLRLYHQGEPVSELTSMFGISRRTFFRMLKLLKVQESLSGTTR